MPPLRTHAMGENAQNTVRAAVHSRREKIVVVDDDPTGTQAVCDVSVYFDWAVPTLVSALEADEAGFYISTNSRSMSEARAAAINREIGVNLLHAARSTGIGIRPVSRSDSTLRGHFPAEHQALVEGLGGGFDGVLLAPFFFEGGRVTIGGTHYLRQGETLLPVGETEFSRDPIFSYVSSSLPAWVEERCRGAVRAEDVAEIPLNCIRQGGPAAVADLLATLKEGRLCVVNSVELADMQIVSAGVVLAEEQGKRFLWRCAASAVQARLGQAGTRRVTRTLLRGSPGAGGLVVVGSWVDLSSRQLACLLAKHKQAEGIEARLDELLDPLRNEAAIGLLATRVDAAISEGRLAVLYTTRGRVEVAGDHAPGSTGDSIGDGLVRIVTAMQQRPAFFIAKGGITSHRMAREALQLKHARVLGALLPGVPVWETGETCTWPGIPYVVFPGNVGAEDALFAATQILAYAP